MGHFFASGGVVRRDRGPSLELLHKLECRACPLNTVSCLSPKMLPTGSRKPTVYFIGEAPGEEEDEKDKQFVGASGRLLRRYIPDGWEDEIRWANVLRCRPPGNRDPEFIEMEACRPFTIRDIEETKPVAIFGFGNIPLKFFVGQTGIKNWRGRRIPVKVGKHVCWYYSIAHPAFILRTWGKYARHGEINSEEERMFMFDIQRALKEVDAGLPEPIVHDRARAEEGAQLAIGKPGDLDRVKRFLEWAGEQEHNGVDYETQGVRPYLDTSRILSAAVYCNGKGMGIAFDHPQARWTRAEREELDVVWKHYLKSPAIKAVHNAAFEMEWTGWFYGEQYVKRAVVHWEDTQSQAVILDERVGDKKKQGPLSLAFLTTQYFGLNIKPLSNVNVERLWEEPIEDVLRYNIMDAKYHDLLFLAQRERLHREGMQFHYEQQVRRVPACVLMQIKGLPVDQDLRASLEEEYRLKLRDIEDDLAELDVVRAFRNRAGQDFAPGNNHHVLFILREIMKAKEACDKDGHWSCGEEVLLAIGDEFCNLMLEWREFSKLKTTYVDRLDPEHKQTIIYSDGRLHPIFNTGFVETGRLSSEDPNAQNWPKREHKEVRNQVAAEDGYVVVAFDYGQIQARNIAMESRDKAFTQALWERYDVHAEWARRIAFEYPSRVGGKKFINDKDVMKAFRNDVKNQFVFPSFFGAQPSSIATYLKIPEDSAERIARDFWKVFSGVKDWQESLVKFYRKHGYVQGLSGRRRRGPLAFNQVINSPIQIDESDIVLDALARLSEEQDLALHPNMCIHDDLTGMWPDSHELQDWCETVVDIMLACPFKWAHVVPLTVEMSIGTKWGKLEEVGTYSSDTWRKE